MIDIAVASTLSSPPALATHSFTHPLPAAASPSTHPSLPSTLYTPLSQDLTSLPYPPSSTKLSSSPVISKQIFILPKSTTTVPLQSEASSLSKANRKGYDHNTKSNPIHLPAPQSVPALGESDSFGELRQRTGMSPNLLCLTLGPRTMKPDDETSSRFVRSAEKSRSMCHRRAYAMSYLSYGYMLFPRNTPPSKVSYKSGLNAAHRLMLVNPALAEHLRSGGKVTVRSVDGQRAWRISISPPVVRLEDAFEQTIIQ